jgi:hypothetical protein
MNTKRRSLVLVDESARHPFRQSLPPHVSKEVASSGRNWSWLRSSLADWRGFFAAYCAVFVMVSIFIA